MKIVVDNNVFFSLMRPSSVNSYLFFSISAEFFSPEYVKLELKKNKRECVVKSGLSEHEFEIWEKEIEGKIKFLKLEEYRKFLKKAFDLSDNAVDTPYIASALAINAVIWSNDKRLKEQSLVKVFSTREVISLIDSLL